MVDQYLETVDRYPLEADEVVGRPGLGHGHLARPTAAPVAVRGTKHEGAVTEVGASSTRDGEPHDAGVTEVDGKAERVALA